MIKKLEKYFIPTLIVSAIIAMAISLIIGLNQSVWFDEAYSIQIAKQPLDQLLHLTAIDTHPPLYYLLLKLWAGVFGWSELALRSMSVLSMGGAIIFAGLLVKKIFNARTSIITLPFIVFAPFLLRYGFELRMYALASLICIAATYFLVCAIESKSRKLATRNYLIYAVLVAIGVYTLYYTVLVWLAHLTWLLWRARQNNENILKSNWLKSYIVSVLLFVPWLPLFIKQITNGALAPISQSMTVDNLVGIISFSFLYRPNWQLDGLMSIIFVFVAAALFYFAFRVFKIVKDKKSRQYLTLLLMYVLVPIAILTIVGLFRPMYVERYLAHVLIAGSIFIGIAVAFSLKKSDMIIKLSAGALLIAMTLGIGQLINVGNYNFQRAQDIQIKQAVKNINCDKNHAVFVAGPYEAIELSYYLSDCEIYFYSDQAKLGGGYAMLSESKLRIKNPATQLDGMSQIFYVYYGDKQQQMPIDMIMTSQQKYDSLTVERYLEK